MKEKPATEYALLGALMLGPRHGYEIIQFLDAGLESAWRVSGSQLYVLLKRLEKDSLVFSILKTQDSRPPKRIFSLTPSGEKMFLEWVRTPTQHVRDLRIEFLAKLFFLHVLSLEGGSELVGAQKKVLEQVKLKLIKREKAEIDPYKRLVLDFKITTLKGWLQWLKKTATPFTEEGIEHGHTLRKTERTAPGIVDKGTIASQKNTDKGQGS